jgi:hypothetical protein
VVDPCCWQEAKNTIAMMPPNGTNVYLRFFLMISFGIVCRRMSSFMQPSFTARFLCQSAAPRRAQHDSEQHFDLGVRSIADLGVLDEC